MPISTEELYKHMFDEHRFASEYRLKLLGSWGVIYAALAAAFAWVHSEAPFLECLVTFLAAGFTYIFWVGDIQHRPAIKRPKNIGENIENDPLSDIPEGRRFFAGLEAKGISHSKVIDRFAKIMLVLLLGATLVLFLVAVVRLVIHLWRLLNVQH
ncbi:MAG: hypothetical protein ACREBG_15655 [Pyrinomonadaceae bacterium]